jgi:helicase
VGSGETAAEGSVVDVAQERWGVPLGGDFPARFSEPGWSYEEVVPRPCPDCAGKLHALRKPYESQGRVYRYTALVCPACSTAFTLADSWRGRTARSYDRRRGRRRPCLPRPLRAGPA